jgi:hypothetical protein
MPVRTFTLVANTVMSLALAPGEWNHTAVFNRSVTDDVYATLNGVNPVADANDVFCIPPGARRELHYDNATGDSLRVISYGAAKIEVEWA